MVGSRTACVTPTGPRPRPYPRRDFEPPVALQADVDRTAEPQDRTTSGQTPTQLLPSRLLQLQKALSREGYDGCSVCAQIFDFRISK